MASIGQEMLTERMAALEDGLRDQTRAALIAAFHLAEFDAGAPLPFQALHQETRLALEVWMDSGMVSPAVQAPQSTIVAELIERDKLAIVRGPGDRVLVVRAI